MQGHLVEGRAENRSKESCRELKRVCEGKGGEVGGWFNGIVVSELFSSKNNKLIFVVLFAFL